MLIIDSRSAIQIINLAGKKGKLSFTAENRVLTCTCHPGIILFVPLNEKCSVEGSLKHFGTSMVSD